MMGSGSPLCEMTVVEAFAETAPAFIPTLGFDALTSREAAVLATKLNRALVRDTRRDIDEVDWPTHGDVLGALLALVAERAEGAASV